MSKKDHYLKKELYDLIQKNVSVFEFLQQGSLDGIWYWDIEAQENEWMSPRFWEVLGYNPAEKEHLAKEWQDLINPDDLKTALYNFAKHCEDPNHPYDQVVRYRHRDGHTVWVRCRGIAIRNETGKPIRMLGAHTDLTPQKIAEEKLRQKTIELEETNKKLQDALANIKVLRGFIPICSKCKKVRDDEGYWNRIESYIKNHSEAQFTHGLCPDCAKEFVNSANELLENDKSHDE
jgi:PAS domain S-box-containing protein